MGGGPLEWTANVFEPYPGSSTRHGDFGKGYRVLRGGVAASDDSKTAPRAARRIGGAADRRDRSFGFRIVRDLP
jgi:formylglycine-generating enzyme required for sulfatase activity